ncbi:MAG TPA: hypothetical protein VNQ90_20195 [Chthoniobacteraceae bacterium]|nr:hypothetical protein [Chthoniobacteraceae bacterium]
MKLKSLLIPTAFLFASLAPLAAEDAGNLLLSLRTDSVENIEKADGTVIGEIAFAEDGEGKALSITQPGSVVKIPFSHFHEMSEGTISMSVQPEVDLASLTHPDDPHLYLLHAYGDQQRYLSIYYNVNNRTIGMAVMNRREPTAYSQARVEWKAGERHHLVCTWTPESLSVHADGILLSVIAWSDGMPDGISEIAIGSTVWGRNPARMAIGEVRISDKAVRMEGASEW